MEKNKGGRPPGPRTKIEIAADSRRTGRPPKAQGERRVSRFSVNLTDSEYDGIEFCAEKAGLSMSAYLADMWKRSEDFKKWRTYSRRSKRG